MPVKTSRKVRPHAQPLPQQGGRINSERWDLSHLAKNPVQRFETLVGEIESKVARFESARPNSVRPWRHQPSTRC